MRNEQTAYEWLRNTIAGLTDDYSLPWNSYPCMRSIARSFGIHYNAIWKIAHNLKRTPAAKPNLELRENLKLMLDVLAH